MRLDFKAFLRRLFRVTAPQARPHRHRIDDATLDERALSVGLRELDEIRPDEVIALGSRNARLCLSYGARRREIAFEIMQSHPEAAWVLSADADGHVREAALRKLSRPPTSPGRLVALSLRLNDWVPQVRAAALDTVTRLFPQASAEVLASAAPYLLRQRFSWGRWTAEEQAAVDNALSRPDVVVALGDLLMRGRTGPLGATLRDALRLRSYDPQLTALAFEANLATVRAVALKTLLDGRAAWPVGYGWAWIDKVYGVRRRVPVLEVRNVDAPEPHALIRRALADRSAIIRRIAAAALIERVAEIPDAVELANSLRHDRSAAVRGRADFLLRDVAART